MSTISDAMRGFLNDPENMPDPHYKDPVFFGDGWDTCFICGFPLPDKGGNCPAYNRDDLTHQENHRRIKEGQEPYPNNPIERPETGDWGPCWVCGAPTDPEGRCTRVNDFEHTEPYKPWMSFFHSRMEAENAPPVTFLIDRFLQREGVTAIAAPVRERKSIIALNIAHALVTGEKLFDHFEVVNKPARVLYLCPEVSLGPFTDRVRKIGLMDYVGRGFFYRTLSADGRLELSDPELQIAISGSVVFLDTAIRFLRGDENSSADVRVFADGIFDLLRHGAEAVVLIHQSPKAQGNAMSLETAMRGSGDMGAFLACCWGTRLQDPENPYTSPSYLECLKQRDFEAKPFEVTCGPDCRMHIVGDPATRKVKLSPRAGNKGNSDGQDAAAGQFIKMHMDSPLRALQKELADLGIARGTTWIGKTKARLKYPAGQP